MSPPPRPGKLPENFNSNKLIPRSWSWGSLVNGAPVAGDAYRGAGRGGLWGGEEKGPFVLGAACCLSFMSDKRMEIALTDLRGAHRDLLS